MKRWWGVLLASGAATAALHLYLGQSGTVDNNVPRFLLFFGIMFFIYLCALPAARILGKSRPVPVLVWGFAVTALSLCAYLTSDLLLSPEVNRYRWDGVVSGAGYNPYQVRPESPELANLRESFDAEVPYPGQKALYPPLAEIMFFFMGKFGLDSLFHYRVLCAAMALLSGLVFLPLCRGAHVPPTRVLVFLWHPLLIVEAAANAHIEIVAVFVMLMSLSLLITRHQLTPLGTLAVATLLKIYPVALFPLYLRRIPIYRVILFFLILGAGVLPFIGGVRELAEGSLSYLSQARFNPGFYILAERVMETVGRPDWTRAIIGLLGFLVAAALYFTDDGTNASILRRGFYLSLPPILLGPVLKPWYLLWLIPFLALVDRRNPLRMAILFLSGSVSLAYLQFWWGHLPGWIALLEYVPVAVLGLWGLYRHRRQDTAKPTPEPVPTKIGLSAGS